jgi:hypothetical protein
MTFLRTNLKGLAAVACTLTIITGCQSKFAESSPDSVKIKGIPLEERLSQKDKVDTRIEDVQKGAEKAKKIIEMFKRIQNPSSKEDVYTPIDFLLDLNGELKLKIPENQGDRLVRRGKIIVPVESLSDACRTVETILETSAIYEGSGENRVPVGERLTYSLKTCGSKDQYLEAIVAEWVGTAMEFKLISKNLETIFRDLLMTDAMKDSTCKITQGPKKIIDAIHCENFNVRLSDSEKAHIKTMSFSNSDDVRFESIADIFENEKLKATSEIKVLSNGEVKVNLKKLGETPSATAL